MCKPFLGMNGKDFRNWTDSNLIVFILNYWADDFLV